MKTVSQTALATSAWLAAMLAWPAAGGQSASFTYETPREFFASGDFDGDSQADLVIVDKATGKFRLGYQMRPGTVTWVDCRTSGIKDVSGFSVGKLLATNHDALAFTSPDANQVTVLDASSPVAPIRPVIVPFTAALGPNTVVALDIGGAGNTSLADFYVSSIYNSPDPNQATLLRNDRSEFPKLSDVVLTGPATHGNRLPLKPGLPDLLAIMVAGEKGASFMAEDLSSGTPVVAATVSALPAGADYSFGVFGASTLPEVLLYHPGETKLSVRSLKESAPGSLQLSESGTFDLGQPIQRIVALANPTGTQLFVIFGEGEQAGVFTFDGVKAPARTQTLVATNELWTWAASLPGGLIGFAQMPGGKFSTRYHTYTVSGGIFVAGAWGGLASLADNDNITIPDIHDRIAANQTANSEATMAPYTNTIPGTQVTYGMVPIHGGEFVMGSPASEPGRKPDEGPQHKVEISPFWMGQCEVTWNEYELFMYPDEEKRTRLTIATDAAGDKLADAVTHPSKPYVEMSFGMGKDGYPAISMTQHAANKYCQWLSAKTGHFYRLPTEAEWEYACRAGTTTTYFFGEDAAKLGDYAWFEQNSDFKYQKVGKKKPNPWGLYDIYGNVVEWVLDQYDPDYYQTCAAMGITVNPWDKATKPYPHSVRGGSWDDELRLCRSAARRGSERAWKMQDPQLPKSVWFFSDAQFVGFRIVRPLKVPAPDDMQKYWTSGVERD